MKTERSAITLWERLNQSKIHRVHLQDWSYIVALFLMIILNIWWWGVDRDASGRGKHSRSVWEDHDTLNIQRQVSLRHWIYLRIIDVWHGGKWKPQDADPSGSTKASRTGVWRSSISSGHLIYIRWCLLRSGSLCRIIYLHRQIRSGNPDRGIYPPDVGWSIKLFLIGSVH
jgi:hypothetical protein